MLLRTGLVVACFVHRKPRCSQQAITDRCTDNVPQRALPQVGGALNLTLSCILGSRILVHALICRFDFGVGQLDLHLRVCTSLYKLVCLVSYELSYAATSSYSTSSYTLDLYNSCVY